MADPINSVAVATGSPVVTGTLTAFQAAEDDIFILNGDAYAVASRDSSSQITLKQPWRGTSLSGVAKPDWTIVNTGPYWQSTVAMNQQLSALLRKFEAGPVKWDASGSSSARSQYDGQAKDFVFLSVDPLPFALYVKLSSAIGDWSAGQALQLKADSTAEAEAARDIAQAAAAAASANAATSVGAAAQAQNAVVSGRVSKLTLAELNAVVGNYPDGAVGVAETGPGAGEYARRAGAWVYTGPTSAALNGRLTPVEDNTRPITERQRREPIMSAALATLLPIGTVTTPNGREVVVFGYDTKLDAPVDAYGPLRPTREPALSEYVDARLTTSRQVISGLRRSDGFTYFFGLAGPTIDALNARSEGIEGKVGAAEPITSLWGNAARDKLGRVLYGLDRSGAFLWPGASAGYDVCIAPDQASRPQVWAITPTDFRQITYVEEGVSGARLAEPASALSITARMVARRAGGAGLFASWNGVQTVADDGTLRMDATYGQSLSSGYGGGGFVPVGITLTPPQANPLPGSVLMFSSTAGAPATFGVRPSDDALLTAPPSRFAYLVDARESVRDFGNGKVLGETPCTAAGLVYQEMGLNRRAPVVVGTYGIGGQAYATLKKGTTAYTNVMRGVDGLVARAAELSRTPRVDVLKFIQGEANATDPQATYAGYLDELRSDFTTDVKAKTGQVDDPVLFVCQMGSQTSSGVVSEVALAQLERGINAAGIVCVGPKYHLTFVDGTHMTSRSYLTWGGYYGRAQAWQLRAGQKWKPLYATAAALSGRDILLTFNLPTGAPLRWDMANILEPGNRGFTVRQSGTVLRIESVDIVASNQVRVRLISAPTGTGIEVGIAAEGAGAQGPQTGRRSNLCDADRTAHPMTGELLTNYACHQRIAVA